MLPGTVRHLAHRRYGFAYRSGDFVVVEAEHLTQHEHCPLVRGERLEQHQHRHRHRFGKHHIGRGIAIVEQQRLGQPRADVVLAATGARPKRIERLAGHQLCKIRLRIPNRREVHVGPPQIAVLQHVVGFGCRAEDLVDDREQQRPQVGEPLGVLVGGGHDSVTTSATNAGCSGRVPPLSQKVRAGLAGLAAQAPHRALADRLLDRAATRRPPM